MPGHKYKLQLPRGIIDNPDIYLTTSHHKLEIITTSRIIISKTQDKPWRFVAKPEEKDWTRLLLR